MPAARKSTSIAATLALPTLDSASARAIALGAGDMSQAIRRRVAELLRSNRNNIFEVLKVGLQELVARKAISTGESQRLNDIFRLVMDVERDRADPEDAYLKIRGMYHEMAIDQQCSSAALAIAGVASSSFALEKNSPLKVNKTAGAAGAIAGAATGVGIGWGIGGPIGGAIGGVIGGAVGATVGLCGSGQT
jgi:hypothetical protein